MRAVVLGLTTVLAMVLAGCMDAKPATAPIGSEEPEPTSNRISRGDREIDFEMRAATPDEIEKLWKNETEHLVMDQVIDYHTDPDPFSNVYDPVTQPIANPCVFNGEIYFNNKQVTLDPRQTIWPGTTNISIGISWTATDATTTADALAVAYRGNGQPSYNVSSYIQNGNSQSVVVEPAFWDLLGATSTGWDFWVCVSDDRATGAEDAGRFFLGNFRMTMTIKRA